MSDLLRTAAAVLLVAGLVPLASADRDAPARGMERMELLPAPQAFPGCSDLVPGRGEVALRFAIEKTRLQQVIDAVAAEGSSSLQVEWTLSPLGFDEGRIRTSKVAELRRPESGRAGTQGTAERREMVEVVVPVPQPGVIQHARITLDGGDGRIVSHPVRFLTPVCPVDGLEREVAP